MRDGLTLPGTPSREVTDAKGQTTQAREKLLQVMDTHLLRLLREGREEGGAGVSMGNKRRSKGI